MPATGRLGSNSKKRTKIIIIIITGDKTLNIPGGVVFCVKYIESFVRLKGRVFFLFFSNRSSLPFQRLVDGKGTPP